MYAGMSPVTLLPPSFAQSAEVKKEHLCFHCLFLFGAVQ